MFNQFCVDNPRNNCLSMIFNLVRTHYVSIHTSQKALEIKPRIKLNDRQHLKKILTKNAKLYLLFHRFRDSLLVSSCLEKKNKKKKRIMLGIFSTKLKREFVIIPGLRKCRLRFLPQRLLIHTGKDGNHRPVSEYPLTWLERGSHISKFTMFNRSKRVKI